MIGLPPTWKYLGPDPLDRQAGWWDTGRGISVLVIWHQIVQALDWRRSNEEPDVWVAAS